MTITAKFAGTCAKCGGPIAVGDRIWFEKGQPVTHSFITVCQANLKAQRETGAPLKADVKVDIAKLVIFLNAATERGLKNPKVRALDHNQSELRLKLAGEKSKYQGAIVVERGATWPREFLGMLLPNGETTHSIETSLPLVNALAVIAQDPAAAAKRYAVLMGRCCFCDLPLTDDGSVEVGYGPICAKRFGLPHEVKGTTRPAQPLLEQDADVEPEPEEPWRR